MKRSRKGELGNADRERTSSGEGKNDGKKKTRSVVIRKKAHLSPKKNTTQQKPQPPSVKKPKYTLPGKGKNDPI